MDELIDPREESVMFYRTKGASMVPYLIDGDKVLVRKVRPEEVKVGDIIVFSGKDGQTIAHRVARIFPKDGLIYFQTKGSLPRHFDPPVSEDKLIGKIFALKRRDRVYGIYPEDKDFILYQLHCYLPLALYVFKKALRRGLMALRLYPSPKKG